MYVDGIKPYQAGILLHALLDLAQGNLPVGNGSRRGNGCVLLDKSKSLKCNLVWNGEELQSDNITLAQKWLNKIAQACKENGNVA